MKHFRIIGDSHSDWNQYLDLCGGAKYTIQVGDLGNLTYSPLKRIDPNYHKVIAGNHDVCDDDHPNCFRNFPHFLGDYGLHEVPEIGQIFYVRGAFSIDGVRTNEELTEEQLESATEFFESARPEIVITHQAPRSLAPIVGNAKTLKWFGWDCEPPTRTGQAFERMLLTHRPKIWVFGHYHRRWEGVVDGTRFVCLDMLVRPSEPGCYLDLEPGENFHLQSTISKV